MFWNLLGIWTIMGMLVLLMKINAIEGYEDEEGFHRGKPSYPRHPRYSTGRAWR